MGTAQDLCRGWCTQVGGRSGSAYRPGEVVAPRNLSTDRPRPRSMVPTEPDRVNRHPSTALSDRWRPSRARSGVPGRAASVQRTCNETRLERVGIGQSERPAEGVERAEIPYVATVSRWSG